MLNLSDQFATYQANMTESMIQLLADDLNVSTDAIKALGVGFWFHEQAWIFAERNAKGEIIGLLKRYMNGKKYMVESSHRGLTYILNPDFKKGKKHGRSLLSDFVRVADAGVKCPICGKPDWCLVSRQDPEHPSEVICPRSEYKTKETPQIGDAGWLHILDKKGSSNRLHNNNSPLQDSLHPYLVVEGASDNLAAYDLGFVAVSKPSAMGGISELTKMLRGKKAVVIGENDSGAGKEGMEITFVKLQKFSKQVSKIMPPTGVKDLRDWVRHGLTSEELLKYIDANADTKTDDDLLDSPLSSAIAEQWLKELHIDGIYTLFRHHRGEFWRYDGVRYKKVEKDILDSNLRDYVRDKYYIETKKVKNEIVTSRKPYLRDEFKIRGIKYELKTATQIRNGSDVDEPFIIEGYKSTLEFNREKQIVFKNGVLNTKTDSFIKLKPELYITSTVPWNYDPDADYPLWQVTLRDWWGEDDDSIRLLQQWYGYNLIATNYLEAMMILFGVSGSGKSTITKVLYEMLGKDKCTPLESQDLKYTFGMEKLVNKNSVIFSEDQATKRADADMILQVIKRLTGRNVFSVRVKYGVSYDTEPFARLTYECDVLPRFVDNAQALERRVNMLYFGRSFKDAPNVLLKEQLIKEVPGIINWAIEGLRDLKQTNKFIVPATSKVAKEELRYMTSPMAAMGKQCFNFDDSNAWVSNDQLFDLHRAWFKESGYSVYSRVWFGRTFSVVFPRLKDIVRDKVRGRKGVSVLPDAATRYLDSPN